MRMLGWLAAIVLVVGAGIVILRLLFPLPSLEGRSESHAIPASPETRLGGALLPEVTTHPGLSGVRAVASGPEAFALRMLLADAADRSIDVQYYIWQSDLTGLQLLDALRRAAERGVRVRLLVDDNGVPDLDPELAALNALPNAEVRLFNPFTLRSPRWAGYGFDFLRLNRRMHNKSFTVDGIATVIGGRNIGDIYFESGADGHYLDLDVLGVGEIAGDVSADFDRYWASASAYPIDGIVPLPADPEAVLDAALGRTTSDPELERFRVAVTRTPLVSELLEGRLALDRVRVSLVSDDPAKGLGRHPRDGLMTVRLGEILDHPQRSIDLISAYFVPGRPLTGVLARWAGEGIRIRTLTNSQDATDVLPVHAGYAKSRPALLAAGVEMYELKSDAGSDQRRESETFGILGSSLTSLHAKTFTVDGSRIFIGSFNFDPRSALLNTEMGFLIDSPVMAEQMTRAFDEQIPRDAYRATLDAEERVVWEDPATPGLTHLTEPNTTLMSRTVVRVLGWLPIDWLL